MEDAKHSTPADLQGQTCAVLLFEEPGGEIESLSLVEGTLEVSGGTDAAVTLRPHAGGDAVRVPPHLVPAIEPLTDDHREALADITSTYWLRAFFDGRLGPKPFDLSTILAQCSGPPAAE